MGRKIISEQLQAQALYTEVDKVSVEGAILKGDSFRQPGYHPAGCRECYAKLPYRC